MTIKEVIRWLLKDNYKFENILSNYIVILSKLPAIQKNSEFLELEVCEEKEYFWTEMRMLWVIFAHFNKNIMSAKIDFIF